MKTYMIPSLAAQIARQQHEQYLAEQSEAYRQGREDIELYPTKAITDRHTGKTVDHRYNVYPTRSQDWDDYRRGVKEYIAEREE